MSLVRLVGQALRWLEALSLRVNGESSPVWSLGTVTVDRLRTVWGLQLPGFGVEVGLTHDELHKFLHDIVVRRKDIAVREWKPWILEDPLVHSYRWLRPHLVPPSPFLQCDPASTVHGSGVLSDPSLILIRNLGKFGSLISVVQSEELLTLRTFWWTLKGAGYQLWIWWNFHLLPVRCLVV